MSRIAIIRTITLLLCLVPVYAGAKQIAAQVPMLVGKIDLNAPIAGLFVTPDGKRAVALLQASGNLASGIRIIDTSMPEKLTMKGFLAVTGELALSPDGKQALILRQLEKREPHTATRHEIISIDLSNPDSPKIAWRREIMARKVVLADDASAYAASSPSKKKPEKGEWQTWQTAVTWIGKKRPDTIIKEALHTNGEMRLSDRATFLLYPRFERQLRVFDLRAKEPIFYEQGHTSLYRYECVSGFLEDGKIIIEDSRTPRFGVYAPKRGIPRIAAMSHDGGKRCKRLNLNTGGSRLILASRNYAGRIDRIDFGRPDRLSFNGSWQLPPATYALAATQTHVFAAGGKNGREMQIFRLDTSTPPSVSWIALEAAHRATMERYNQSIKKKEPVPYLDAVDSLEAQGILQVLDAPVKEISNKTAAVILNDYGFLACKGNSQSKMAEIALRRAIHLDPERALARLNLADMLRERLSTVTDYPARQRQLSEIKKLYQKYLELGGKNNAQIDSFLKGEPERTAGDDICRAIAGYTNAGRLQEIVAGSGVNIKAGTQRVDLVFGTEGTAHVPTVYAFDSATDFPLDESKIRIPSDGDLWGNDELGLVVYRDYAHIIHYRGLNHPVATTSLAGGKDCKFRIKTVERIGKNAIEPALCRSLIEGRGPSSIDFKRPAPIAREDVNERYSETGANNMRFLDVANDGKPVNVAEMELTSGSGPGCDAWFYDILDKTGQNFLSSPKHELLMKMQNMDPSNRFPVYRCANKPRFFTYKGKVYFENKPAIWPPTSQSDQYHHVTRIDRGRVVDVCGFEFRTTVSPGK